MKINRRMRTGLALAAAGMALAACGQPQAGAALTWDGGRITEDQVATEAKQLADALGRPVDRAITKTTIERLAQVQLAELTAQAVGVDVSQAEVDKQLAEGQVATADELAEQDLTISALEGVVRARLLSEAVRAKLQGSSADAGLALGRAIVDVTYASNFQANPRFGFWSAEQFALVADQNALSRPPANSDLSDLLSRLKQLQERQEQQPQQP